MTIDTIISGLVGFGGALLGAGVAWGVIVQRVRSLEKGQDSLAIDIHETEIRCKERDAKLERDVELTRSLARDAHSRVDRHLDAHATIERAG